MWLSVDDEPGEGTPAALDPATGTFSAALTLSAGVHPVRALARDRSGNEATADAAVTVVDRVAPEIEVLAPEYEVDTAEQTFVLRVLDNFGAAWVTLQVPRTDPEPLLAAQNPEAPELWHVDALLLPGRNPVRVEAEDLSGNLASLEGEVLLRDDAAPTLVLEQPVDGARIDGPLVRVSGVATDELGLEEVVLSLDGDVPEGGRLLPEGPDGRFELILTAGLGAHRIEALARDLAGNVTVLPARAVECVDPEQPTALELAVDPPVLLVEPGAVAQASALVTRADGTPAADGVEVRFFVEPAGTVLPQQASVSTLGGVALLELSPVGPAGTVTVRAEVVAPALRAERSLSVVRPSQVEVGICHAGGVPIWGLDLLVSVAAQAAVQVAPPGGGAARSELPGFLVEHGRVLPVRVAAASATPAAGAAELLTLQLPLVGVAAAGPADFVLSDVRLVTDGLGAVAPQAPDQPWLRVCRADNQAGDLPPIVRLQRPPAVVEQASLDVRGAIEDADLATVRAVLRHAGADAPINLQGDGTFESTVLLVAGRNRVEVLGTDAGGQVGSDAFEVTFAVADEAPVLTLDPLPETVATPELLVQGRAQDDGGVAGLRLEVGLEGAAADPVALDGEGRFSHALALPLGPSLVIARAIDGAGNVTTALHPVQRVEDGGPPAVDILTPHADELFEALPIDLQARVEGGATRDVQATVWVDGGAVAARYSPFSRLVTARLEPEPGERTIEVQVEDQLGRTARASVTVRYVPPDQPPVLTVQRPADGARLAATRIAVAGTVSDDLGLDGLRVEVRLDEQPYEAAAVTADGRWSHSLSAALGPHTVQVRAVDSTGHRATTTLEVELVAPPVVVVSELSIGGPEDGFNVDEGPAGTVGDPDPDNALSGLGGLVNPALRAALDDGSLVLLVEFSGLAALPGPGEEVLVDVQMYTGVDLDGDPSDNFSGEEPFAVDPASLGADGLPSIRFEQVRVRGPEPAAFDTYTDGRPAAFGLDVPGDAPVRLEIEPAYAAGHLGGAPPDVQLGGQHGPAGDLALIGGVVPACALTTPIDVGGIVIAPLQLLVNSIDVDLNGDGVLDRETTVCDDVHSNPDGLSVGLVLRGVPARLEAP